MVHNVPNKDDQPSEISTELNEETQPANPPDDTEEEMTQPADPIAVEEETHLTNAVLTVLNGSGHKEPASSPLSPAKSATLGNLHLISYLLWEREGQSTFEVTRAHLLDTITRLTDHLRKTTDGVQVLKHIVLGGQTILIEDIAAVRSDLIALLAIYNAGDRFGIGPWYVQVDNTLVSGESLIRNLLLGRADVMRHGIKLTNVAFMPSAVENVAQLPQILNGFDISALLLTSPQGVMSLPFRWIAPDDSAVLVINHHDAGGVQASIEEQSFGQPDGPFLWLNYVNQQTVIKVPDLSEDVSEPIVQSTLNDYIAAVRKGLPDLLRPALKGELRLLGPGYNAGRLSTRLYLKQANARLQTLLTHQTEPWLAIALTHAKLDSADNLRALLDYSWRLLLKNQSRNNLTGCSHDAVSTETEIHNRHIEDVTQRIQDKSFDALPGTLTRTIPYEQTIADRTETYIGVWNSHSFEVEQIVELSLILPKGKHPAILKDDKGEEVNYSWEPDTSNSDTSCVIGFRAKVASVGYRVYTLEISDKEPESHHRITSNKGIVIGNTAGETLIVEKGQLVWARPKQRLTDFVTFYDGGDAGDTYNYKKPQPDVVVRSGMTDSVDVQTTATYERLIYRERMRIAPELKEDLTRTRGLSLLDISTTATFYDTIPGIFFRTTFSNKAQDHRLRAHLRTGIKADSILTDSPFNMTQRFITKDGSQLAQKPQLNIFPLQSVAAVQGENETIALLSRGLSEVEPVLDNGEISLALTLLRSVGWLQRGTGSERGTPARGAQYERDVTVDYAILPMKQANHASLMQAGMAYNAPLQAYQYHDKPNPIQRSYLSLDNPSAIMTALKPPQTGKGWIMRLVNPTNEEISATLTTHGKMYSAKLVNLAEEDQAEYTVKQGSIKVTIAPHKIHTLRLEFGE